MIGDPVNEAARLTEVAKHDAGRVLASGGAVAAADEEALRWRKGGSQVLRDATIRPSCAFQSKSLTRLMWTPFQCSRTLLHLRQQRVPDVRAREAREPRNLEPYQVAAGRSGMPLAVASVFGWIVACPCDIRGRNVSEPVR